MSIVSLSPDDLVEHIIEEVIVSHMSSVKLPQVWKIVSNRLERESLPAVYKAIIWSWLVKKPEIEVFENDLLLPWEKTFDLDKLLEQLGGDEKIIVKIEEGKQWLYLTNNPKEGNSIGALPLELLKHIISRREKGISGAELSRAANQDPRSLTSRLTLLEKEGLIKKKNAAIPGVTTSLVIHTKYYLSLKEALPTFDRALLNRQIVDVIKHSKNQIRTQRDVGAELNYTTDLKTIKKFRRMTHRLCKLGYLKPVLVAPPHNENKRATTRALMYIKDYEVGNDTGDDDEDDDDDFDEEEDDNLADLTEQSNVQLDSSFFQGNNIKIIDDDGSLQDDDEDVPILNAHFPVLSQISEIVRFSGSRGIPAMNIQKSVVGSRASWFARYIYDMKFNTAGPDHLSNYRIVRALDSEGKVKFYRYFTQEEYSKLTGTALSPIAGEFPELEINDDPSLAALSLQFSKHFSNGGLEIVHCPDGVDRLYWTGITDPLLRKLYQMQLKQSLSSNILTSTSFINDSTKNSVAVLKEKLTAAQVKRLGIINGEVAVGSRGRPKKGASVSKRSSVEIDEQPLKKLKVSESKDEIAGQVQKYQPRPLDELNNTEATSPNLTGIFETMPRPSRESVEPQSFSPAPWKSDELESDVKFNINFSAFGGSIRSNQRRQLLLNLMKKNGGFAVLNLLLSREVGDLMKSSTRVDKLTLKNDAELLQKNGQVDIIDFKEKRKEGEEGVVKKLLVMTENRPSDDKIKEFVENHNDSLPNNYNLVEHEVVRIPVEFRSISVPKAFLPRKTALERKLAEVRPSKASFTPKRTKKVLLESSSKKSHKKTTKSKTKTKTKEENDPMLSYLSNIKDLKRKVRAKKTKRKTEGSGFTREKRREAYDLDYIISALKAHTMVTSLLFNKAVVDWKSIGDLLGENADKSRRRWPHIRRQLRFVTLPRIKESWQKFIDSSVKNGIVTYDMLANSDFKSIFDLWNESEVDNFVDDELLLYSNYEENFQNQVFKQQLEDKIIFSALPSSLEKTRYLTNIAFTSAVEPIELQDDKYDKVKAILKSIFATDMKDFNPQKSRKILEAAGDYFPALKELELSKEIAFLGENSDTKFTIPEKTWLGFQQKINEKFLEDATNFLKVFAEIVDAHKGMILSAMTPDSSIATIIHLLVERKLKVVLVDKILTKKLSGYFTRNFNGQLLEVDFVLTLGPNENVLDPLPEVAVPIGAPCTRVWIDMNGHLNSGVWKTIVSTVIHHIYFRPGVDLNYLYETTRSLLQLFELREVLQWLIDKKAIEEYGRGYHVLNNFYTVIG